MKPSKPNKILTRAHIDPEVINWFKAHSKEIGASLSSTINDALRLHCGLSRYQHVKRGTKYSVLGEFEVQATEPIKEGDLVVGYKSDTGSKWMRPAKEFYDGRFTKL